MAARIAPAPAGLPRVPLLAGRVVIAEYFFGADFVSHAERYLSLLAHAGVVALAVAEEVVARVDVDQLEAAEVDRIRRAGPAGAERLRVFQRQPQRCPAARRVAARDSR